ncbi:MAG: PA2169 family four-helix-bundle protein [Niabella sp.]
MNHKACIEALNDLIKINNDRVIGYRKAINELKEGEDEDLKTLFTSMANESEQYIEELSQKINEYGGDATDSATASGKLYQAWMDVKAFFTGGDRKTVLNNCEAGEDAAQRAYQAALDDEEVMEETKLLIAEQKAGLKQSHDKIRALRDTV